MTSWGLGMPGEKPPNQHTGLPSEAITRLQVTPTLVAPHGGLSAYGGLHLLGKDGYKTGERTDADPNTVDAHAARAGIAAQIVPLPERARAAWRPRATHGREGIWVLFGPDQGTRR